MLKSLQSMLIAWLKAVENHALVVVKKWISQSLCTIKSVVVFGLVKNSWLLRSLGHNLSLGLSTLKSANSKCYFRLNHIFHIANNRSYYLKNYLVFNKPALNIFNSIIEMGGLPTNQRGIK